MGTLTNKIANAQRASVYLCEALETIRPKRGNYHNSQVFLRDVENWARMMRDAKRIKDLTTSGVKRSQHFDG